MKVTGSKVCNYRTRWGAEHPDSLEVPLPRDMLGKGNRNWSLSNFLQLWYERPVWLGPGGGGEMVLGT